MFYREAGQFKTSYAADQAIFPIAQDRWFVWGVLALAALAVPMVASEYLYRAILIPFLILSLAAIGLNILVGYCGQISLGSGAFMAVGAYAAYNFSIRIPELNLIVVFLLSGGVAALVGVLFGIPSLRIKGFYLAVATLAAQFFIDWLFIRVKWFTNYTSSGSVNAPRIEMLGFAFDTPTKLYLLTLGIVAVGALVAKNLTRARIGRSWMAIRDMDIAAEIILWAFVHLGSWEPAAFDINRSFTLLFMVIIGGLGSILGCFLGAAFILIVPLALNQLPAMMGMPISTALAAHLEAMIFGALIVFFLIVEPHGLARLWAIAKEKLRIWPFPH